MGAKAARLWVILILAALFEAIGAIFLGGYFFISLNLVKFL